MMAGAQSG